MMKARTPIEQQNALAMDLENAENAATFFISFLGDVGANLQKDFPQFAMMLPNCFLWAAAAKISRDFGPETAARALERIAGLIRDQALDPEAPDPPFPVEQVN